MTREEYVKKSIQLSGHSLKSFAKIINLPYTTLLGMLKNGLGGAAVDNVIKVCKGLDITVEDLNQFDNSNGTSSPFYANSHEKKVIVQYRKYPELQNAVNKLLDVNCGPKIKI